MLSQFLIENPSEEKEGGGNRRKQLVPIAVLDSVTQDLQNNARSVQVTYSIHQDVYCF